MKREDVLKMAHDIIERRAVESDYIEYKRSADIKDGILKTACAFSNNYMNREIGLIFIGIEEVDDFETGIKAIPKRAYLAVLRLFISFDFIRFYALFVPCDSFQFRLISPD